MEPAAVTQQD